MCTPHFLADQVFEELSGDKPVLIQPKTKARKLTNHGSVHMPCRTKPLKHCNPNSKMNVFLPWQLDAGLSIFVVGLLQQP